jgi:hypothetical protein
LSRGPLRLRSSSRWRPRSPARIDQCLPEAVQPLQGGHRGPIAARSCSTIHPAHHVRRAAGPYRSTEGSARSAPPPARPASAPAPSALRPPRALGDPQRPVVRRELCGRNAGPPGDARVSPLRLVRRRKAWRVLGAPRTPPSRSPRPLPTGSRTVKNLPAAHPAARVDWVHDRAHRHQPAAATAARYVAFPPAPNRTPGCRAPPSARTAWAPSTSAAKSASARSRVSARSTSSPPAKNTSSPSASLIALAWRQGHAS